MGQKDRLEKYLENYNDVFADRFNVLLFKKKWIREEKLRSLDTESLYKAADGSLGVQRRDILKEYGSENTEEVVTKALEDNLIPLEKSVI